MTITATAVQFVFDTARSRASTSRVRHLLEALGYVEITFASKEKAVTFCGIRHGEAALEQTKEEIGAIWTVLGMKVEVSYFYVFSPTPEPSRTLGLRLLKL